MNRFILKISEQVGLLGQHGKNGHKNELHVVFSLLFFVRIFHFQFLSPFFTFLSSDIFLLFCETRAVISQHSSPGLVERGMQCKVSRFDI